ncbi:MAG: hypothetical protein RBT55_16615 [Rhodocyclaceae bacterium]|jgi:hypothetical protein|nr:hypothetical protein [Rhodocyclaceae bacterium]
MSYAYYIVTREGIDGFDPFVNGKAIAQADEKVFERLCNVLKVRPLTDFISQDPDDLADFIEGEGLNVPDALPDEVWFDAEDGLVVVRALRQYLSTHPNALNNAAAISDELAEYQAVLERIQQAQVQWHLAVDF